MGNNLLWFIFCANIFCTCSNSSVNTVQNEPKLGCKDIIRLSSNFVYNYQLHQDKRSLDSALKILHTPPDCDEKATLKIYHTKMLVFLLYKRDDDALRIIDTVLNLNISKTRYFYEPFEIKGVLLEQKGITDSAKYYYHKADLILDGIIKDKPKDVNAIAAKISNEFISGGKKQALHDLDKFISEDPKNEVLIELRKEMQQWDRNEVLRTIGFR
jgi:tetratricopeptide (TPR) repeat protein